LRIFGFRFVACAVVCFAATGVHAQTAQVTAIRAGRLFDSKSGKIAENQVILVEEEKITAVGPADRVQIPAGAQVIDLSKGTVLPGLIDSTISSLGGRRSPARSTTLANTARCSRWQMPRRICGRDSRACAI
jgi:hypothetical protein